MTIHHTMHSKIEIAVLDDRKKDVYSFYTLNISETGMLIASNEIIKIDTTDTVSVVIDPWQQYLENFISCDVRVDRMVENGSKVLSKYKAVFSDSKDISTILRVYFENMLSHSKRTLCSYLHQISSRNAA